MTLLIPLDAHSPPPSKPAFVAPVADPATYTSKVVKAILKAKRIALVCGAGISVQAGIPDFRSADGLFQSIKRENPKENLTSGKDLFDASVFNSEHTTALFCQMIAQLSRLSSNAAPTPFHSLLKDLDERGKLLRVYTQNIDALEEKAGLTLGLPEHRTKAKSKAAKGIKSADSVHHADVEGSIASTFELGGTPPASSAGPKEIPRCIPLHGTLKTMHCVSCTHTYPLTSHLTSLLAGFPPDCPDCISLERTRSVIGKRPRGVGKLRPSVVLYNEDHRDGEGVGEVVQRDLVGGGRGRSGADLLLVVGTSLRVPGTKRIVREFAKSVKAKQRARTERAHEVAIAKLPLLTPATTPTSSPTPSPRRSPDGDADRENPSKCSTPSVSELPPEERPVTSIYINLDFPVPTREWDGVFDAWIQGDAQAFAEIIRDEMEREEREREEKIEKEERVKGERREREERRRRERDEKAREAAEKARLALAKAKKSSNGKKRSISHSSDEGKLAKKRRVKLIVHESSFLRSPKSPTSPTSPRSRTYAKPETRTIRRAKVEIEPDVCEAITITPPKTPTRRPSYSRVSSLASQSPHAVRLRAVPEVVIGLPSPGSSSSGSTHNRSKARRSQPDSPLDLLANAAASLSLTRPTLDDLSDAAFHASSSATPIRPPSPCSRMRQSSPSRFHPTSTHYCPRSYCGRQRNTSDDAERCLESSYSEYSEFSEFASPLSFASTLTPVPSPLMLHTSPPLKSPRPRSTDIDDAIQEAHVPGPPSTHQSRPRTMKPYFQEVCNPVDGENSLRSGAGTQSQSAPAKRRRGTSFSSPQVQSRAKKMPRIGASAYPPSSSLEYPLVPVQQGWDMQTGREVTIRNARESYYSDSEAGTPVAHTLRLRHGAVRA